MLKYRIIYIAIMLIFCSSRVSYASSYVVSQSRDSVSTKDAPITIYFKFERAVIDSGYMNNAAAVRELNRVLTDNMAMAMDSIIVVATASPDDNPDFNMLLSMRRAQAVKSYIVWKYPFVDKYKIKTYPTGEGWSGLKRMVEADDQMPCREKILEIIDQDVNPAT